MIDVLDRNGRYDALLKLRNAASQSAEENGATLDMGSSLKSSFAMIGINSIAGSEGPALTVIIQASNDGENWESVAGMRLHRTGLFRVAIGDRGYRYWRYNASCSGENPLINWSAYLSVD